jgi:ribonuclease T1
MTTQKNNKPNQSRNRPTDPFGGPPKNRNSISFGVVLLAFAFFMLLQWSGGDLSGLLNGSVALPTVAAPSNNPQPTLGAQATEEHATEGNDAPAAQATASSDPQPTPTPASAGQARATETPRPTAQPSPTANAPPANAQATSRASDLPTIAYDELPREAWETIALIEQDGSFPFSRDGVTFQNRERLLPRHPEGYYREYTVITPGSNDRGARRIVTGDEGEMYYTDDHYDSFREIMH